MIIKKKKKRYDRFILNFQKPDLKITSWEKVFVSDTSRHHT